MIAWFNKYAAFAFIHAKRTLTYKGPLAGTSFLLAILIIIFYKLWTIVFAETRVMSVPLVDVLWYLAITETIVNMSERIEKRINEDVRDSSVSYYINKPISYILMRHAEGIGGMFVKMPIFFTLSLGMIYLLTRELPTGFHLLPIAIFLAAMASFLHHIFLSMTGILAFWFQDARPFYMIYTKFIFVFGGLFIPLDFFPQWMQTIAYWTPPGVILYGPASLMIHTDISYVVSVFVRLIFWIIVSFSLMMILNNKAVKGLEVNGG